MPDWHTLSQSGDFEAAIVAFVEAYQAATFHETIDALDLDVTGEYRLELTGGNVIVWADMPPAVVRLLAKLIVDGTRLIRPSGRSKGRCAHCRLLSQVPAAPLA